MPKTIKLIEHQPREEDILLGRGALTFRHPGNVFLRELIQGYKMEYVLAETKAVKSKIGSDIFSKIVKSGRKFLMQVDKEGVKIIKLHSLEDRWYLADEEAARNKIMQSLREDQPNVLRQLSKQQGKNLKSVAMKKADKPVKKVTKEVKSKKARRKFTKRKTILKDNIKTAPDDSLPKRASSRPRKITAKASYRDTGDESDEEFIAHIETEKSMETRVLPTRASREKRKSYLIEEDEIEVTEEAKFDRVPRKKSKRCLLEDEGDDAPMARPSSFYFASNMASKKCLLEDEGDEAPMARPSSFSKIFNLASKMAPQRTHEHLEGLANDGEDTLLPLSLLCTQSWMPESAIKHPEKKADYEDMPPPTTPKLRVESWVLGFHPINMFSSTSSAVVDEIMMTNPVDTPLDDEMERASAITPEFLSTPSWQYELKTRKHEI